MIEPENIKAVMMGPCCICGDMGYSPSMGGPHICPQCDAGNFTPATVMRQAKVIEQLRAEVGRLKADKECLATGWESELVGMDWKLSGVDCCYCKGHGRIGLMACTNCGATGRVDTDPTSPLPSNQRGGE